jgi:hypothetical protein
MIAEEANSERFESCAHVGPQDIFFDRRGAGDAALEVGQKIALRALVLDRLKDRTLRRFGVKRSVLLLSFLMLLGLLVLIKHLDCLEVLGTGRAFPASGHRH